MEENQQLKEAGLKITMPRLKILQILEQSVEHHFRLVDIISRVASRCLS